jgi:hypothetical protein
MGSNGTELTLVLDGHELTISNPAKGYFAERGETKLDPVRFYEAVRDPLMAAMGGRPVLLQRFPEGARGSSFFQKRLPASRPPWLQTATVTTPNGTTSDALVATDLAHVAWAVNMGCLGFHVWPTLAADPAHADELSIDLDPSPGVGFGQVREAAFVARDLLAELGLAGWPTTTGNRTSTSTCGWSAAGTASRCARPRSHLPGRSNAATPTCSPAPGGRRSGAGGCSSTSTRTPRTRPCSVPGASGPVPGLRCRHRSSGRS